MIDLDRVAYALRTDEIERLRRLPYPAYLKSDWWQWKRSRALKRAHGDCELCRQAEATQVHHTSYEHIGCERNHELVALCRTCHQHITVNGLGKLTRHELLGRRREILHSPEFQRATLERLEY